MTTTTQKKGPEALERLPSRVPNSPRKDKLVNAVTPSTVLVPFPAETGFTWLNHAMIRLRLAIALMDARQSFDADGINDLQALLYDVQDTLEPVATFLDEIEYEPGMHDLFTDCRRRWLVERTQGAA